MAGALTLFTSGFMPIVLNAVVNYSNNTAWPQVTGEIIGFSNPLWYIILLFTSIIFATGYFFNKIINRVLVFVFIPLFVIGILFFTIVFTFTIAIDPGDPILMIGKGYYVTILGYLLVITATVISVLRKRDLTKTNDTLLDN